ncbi:hypothetical protein D3C84_795220 [compost metagenome]
MPGNRHQIGKHRVADSGGDLGIRQGIEADIDHRAFADDLHPVEDRPRIGQIRIVRREQLRGFAGGELFQQRQQAGDDLVEIGAVVAHGTAQAVEHRVVDADLRQVLLQRDHALFPADHVARDVFVVQPSFELHDDVPGLGFVPGEVMLGVLDEQRVDIDHVALDQQVVRALAQLDQGAGDDVDEAPGELPKRCAIALA